MVFWPSGFLEGAKANKLHILNKIVVVWPCRLRWQDQTTTIFLKMCGLLALVPQAPKTKLGQQHTSGSLRISLLFVERLRIVPDQSDRLRNDQHEQKRTPKMQTNGRRDGFQNPRMQNLRNKCESHIYLQVLAFFRVCNLYPGHCFTFFGCIFLRFAIGPMCLGDPHIKRILSASSIAYHRVVY